MHWGETNFLYLHVEQYIVKVRQPTPHQQIIFFLSKKKEKKIKNTFITPIRIILKFFNYFLPQSEQYANSFCIHEGHFFLWEIIKKLNKRFCGK